MPIPWLYSPNSLSVFSNNNISQALILREIGNGALHQRIPTVTLAAVGIVHISNNRSLSLIFREKGKMLVRSRFPISNN